jgi:hypothetical protein
LPHAAAVKWLPFAVFLGKAICDCPEHDRVNTKAAMAALDFDIVGRVGRGFDAILPRDNPVIAAEDRG